MVKEDTVVAMLFPMFFSASKGARHLRFLDITISIVCTFINRQRLKVTSIEDA